MSRIAKFMVWVLCLALAGCGSTASSPSIPAAVPASLNGNWLITGSIPSLSLSNAFGMAATLDVVNGQVIADVDVFYPCSNSGFGSDGQAAPASLTADGSFTLQPALVNGAAPTLNYAVQGKVPQSANESWTGTFTATSTNIGCSPLSGTFSAVPIAPVTGTFTGNATITARNSNLAALLSVALSLQQGGPASLDATATSRPVNSVNALSGSIHTTGSNCFSNGTISGYNGDVLGGSVGVNFNMDDGSLLVMIADIKDPSTSALVVRTMSIQGGACDGWFGGSKAVLVRQ